MTPGPAVGDDIAAGPASGAGRGALLLAGAVLLGALVLNQLDGPPPGSVTAGTTRTTEARDDTAATSTTAPTPTVPLRTPREVKVLVANASGVSKAGATVKEKLRVLNYNTPAPTNAKQINVPAFIYYATPDFQREAQELAKILNVPLTQVQVMPTPPPVADLLGANVLILVGPQLAQQVAASPATTAPAGGTATTAKPGTATTAKPGGTATTASTGGSRATTTTARP